MAYKIAVVGNKDVVTAFKLIGFDVYPVKGESDSEETIQRLARENYGIIYVTEDVAQLIPDTIRAYDSELTPTITLIPSHKGSQGIGLGRVNRNVEKAIGSNILEGGDE